MTAMTAVMIPLDGSASATAAIPVAQRLGSLLNGTVVLLYVGDDVGSGGPSPESLVQQLSLSPDDVLGLVIERRPGPAAAEVIVREAAEWNAAMIVMCSQTRTDIQSRTFGHVAQAVVRSAPCPVVLVPPTRGREPWHLRQLLLPHDGTPTSAATIAPAADLALAAGAEMLVLHVPSLAHEEEADEPGTLRIPRYVDQPQHEWQAWEREFVDRLCALGQVRAGTKVRFVMGEGEVGAAIVRGAAHSDLIVLGWRGVLEPGRAMTMQSVIRDAACPVIMFRLDKTR